MTSNGATRSARVYLPSTYNANQHFPLLLVFHASNGTAAGIEKITGLDAQAEKFGFVVVYPASIGPTWNNRGSSDLRFVQALLATLATKLSLDPQRVYASGYSDGGGFAQTLVCEQANAYAGLATVGTNMGSDEEARCHPSQPVTYLTFHGTADPDVPYNGGPGAGPYAAGGVTNSSVQVTQFWASLDGCTAVEPSTTTSDHLSKGGDVTDVVTTAAPCRDGTSATLYTIPGGGHTWPGGTQSPSLSLGDVSTDLNASAIIMQTLSSHRSAAANACFEGASPACAVTNGAGTQACVGGQLQPCKLSSCNRGFVSRSGACVPAGQ